MAQIQQLMQMMQSQQAATAQLVQSLRESALRGKDVVLQVAALLLCVAHRGGFRLPGWPGLSVNIVWGLPRYAQAQAPISKHILTRI